MSLDPPTYLNSLQNNIRARPIPWDGAVRAGHLSDEQLKKIKSVDKVRKEQRKQTVEADPKSFGVLLIGGKDGGSVLEKAAKRTDIVQYILVLANDLINGTAYLDLVCHALGASLIIHRRSLVVFFYNRTTRTLQSFPRPPQPFLES